MLWFRIAWRNLWRNPRRTVLQLVSIATSLFIATFMTNLQSGVWESVTATGIRLGSGHVGFYHQGYQESRALADMVPVTPLLAELAQEPEVESCYPRLRVGGLLRSSRDSRPAGAVGLDFARERDVSPLLDPRHVIEGELPDAAHPNGILVGDVLARELGVKVGKKVVYTTQDVHGTMQSRLFRVSGLMHSGIRELDAGGLVLPRQVLGELIGQPDGAHELAVMLKHGQALNMVLPRLEAIAARHPGVEAMRWERAMPGLASTITMKKKGADGISFILFLLVSLGTLNTLLMSVMERTRELGVLRALGIKGTYLRRMILLEAGVLSGLGVVAGLTMTVLLGLYTSTHGINVAAKMKDLEVGGVSIDPVMRSGWEPGAMLGLSLFMILLTLLASLYPAHRALSIRPSEAMRSH